MRWWLAAALLAYVVARVFAHDVVFSLTSNNFDAAIKAHPLIFVQFYAPWCSHCAVLAPEFEAAAKRLEGKVPFAKIDATTEVLIAQRFGVDGYPTIVLFRNGRPEEYTGQRNEKGMTDWVLDAAGPALRLVKSDADLAELIQSKGSKPIFVAKGGDGVKAALGKAANEHRLLAQFLFLDSWDGPPAIDVHRGIDEIVELNGAETSDPEVVYSFVMREMLSPFGEINEENFEGYLAMQPQGMLWVCFRPESWKQEARRYANVFREVAKTLSYPVVYTDTKEFHEHVREELGCSQFPMMVLQLGNLTNEDVRPVRYKTILSEEGMAAAPILAWVSDVLAGKVDEDDGLEELDRADQEPDDESSDTGDAKQVGSSDSGSVAPAPQQRADGAGRSDSPAPAPAPKPEL